MLNLASPAQIPEAVPLPRVAEQTPGSKHALDPELVNQLTSAASQLGYEVVDIAGFLDDLEKRSVGQITALSAANQAVEQVVTSTNAANETALVLAETSKNALQEAQSSAEVLKEATEKSTGIAEWVSHAAAQIAEAGHSLKEMRKSNAEVSEIASKVRYLSINARIEASRADKAGRGFSVIAENINDLSNKTNEVAVHIQNALDDLAKQIEGLVKESSIIQADAEGVIESNNATVASLAEITSRIVKTNESAAHIRAESEAAKAATQDFQPVFESIGVSVRETAGDIKGATKRANTLIDLGEDMVQRCFSVGGTTNDSMFIERVQADAATLSRALQKAVEDGRITLNDLFHRSYEPIHASDPPQVMAPFTTLTDELFTPIQEAALELDARVVFCAAVNQDGYLPTHNLKFSHPPSNDVAWNTANCRNRRIFDDRVGLKAGTNQRPFLLQVYRRDMGNGAFKLMLDVSSPIRVNDQHWGGLRLAYAAA